MASKISEMKKEDILFRYTLRLGDNALVLSQRLIEYVTRAPELEEELANANLALDYLGQARLLYSYAGALEGKGRTEDDFASLRAEREFTNLLLIEQPNGDFARIVARSVLFDTFYLHLLDSLTGCEDSQLAGIAARAVKEVRYHLRYVSQWLVRLGDGTEESHRRSQEALHGLWKYTGEMFAEDPVDRGMRESFGGPDLALIEKKWRDEISALVSDATLELPADDWMAGGGKSGQHTESFGYLIAEMQYMQRAYPGLTW